MRSDAPAPETMKDSTAEALSYLRDVTAAARREQRRGSMTLVYGVAITAVMLGGPYLLAAVDMSWPGGATGTARLLAALPVLLPAVSATVLFLAVRNAAWRGPVRVDLPSASWALPQPLLRQPLLMPSVKTAAVGCALVGAVTGAAAGFVLGTLPQGTEAAATVAGAWQGVASGVLAVLAGVLVERHDRLFLRVGRVVFALGWVVTAVLVALSAAVLLREVPTWAGDVLLWSGPWGWAAQPLVAAAGGEAAGWPLACVLLAVLLGAVLRHCVRSVPLIPGESLRRRAAVAAQVTASFFSLELRQVKFTIQATHRGRARFVPRLPAPRQAWLILPWRDVTSLLRAPSRLAWCAVAVAAAVTSCAAAATSTDVRLQILFALLAFCVTYFAAAQLVEPARVDSDDLRRAANLPYSLGSLALRHAIVPTAGVYAGMLVAVVACVMFGGWNAGFAALLLSVPAAVGAALVSAYRGTMPAHLAIGVETPFGNTAPLQMTGWYLRGPLGALLLVSTALVVTTHQDEFGFVWALWLLATGAGQLLWARYTAAELGC